MSAREKIAGMFPSRSLGESVADEILAEHRAEVLREAAELGRQWSRDGYSAQEIAKKLDRMANNPTNTECPSCGCIDPGCANCKRDCQTATVVTARWGGEEPWIDEDGSISVELTVDGRPVVLSLDGDAPKLLADELADCHRVNSHSCDNCDGIDHDTPEEN